MSEVQKQLILEINRAFNLSVKRVENLESTLEKTQGGGGGYTDVALKYFNRISDLQDLQSVKSTLILDVNSVLGFETTSVASALDSLREAYTCHVANVNANCYSALEKDKIDYDTLLHRCYALRDDLSNISDEAIGHSFESRKH